MVLFVPERSECAALATIQRDISQAMMKKCILTFYSFNIASYLCLCIALVITEHEILLAELKPDAEQIRPGFYSRLPSCHRSSASRSRSNAVVEEECLLSLPLVPLCVPPCP
ncbi:hypothetical protein RvY_15418 [Ramazzottius varieornatus]|uniref:Uncharacterized protein n=1 Tax=Ramazzottius varieornatus TaxID=947166 RepID=A0A1D1VUW5_RAMVA|nr:hypothetical protein RvY_15418 [Ramazzottius varieornatus]